MQHLAPIFLECHTGIAGLRFGRSGQTIPIARHKTPQLPSAQHFAGSFLFLQTFISPIQCFSVLKAPATRQYGRILNHDRTQIAEKIADLRKQQMDVLSAAKRGDITDDDVAEYYSLDLDIRYLADEMHREDNSL